MASEEQPLIESGGPVSYETFQQLTESWRLIHHSQGGTESSSQEETESGSEEEMESGGLIRNQGKSHEGSKTEKVLLFCVALLTIVLVEHIILIGFKLWLTFAVFNITCKEDNTSNSSNISFTMNYVPLAPGDEDIFRNIIFVVYMVVSVLQLPQIFSLLYSTAEWYCEYTKMSRLMFCSSVIKYMCCGCRSQRNYRKKSHSAQNWLKKLRSWPKMLWSWLKESFPNELMCHRLVTGFTMVTYTLLVITVSGLEIMANGQYAEQCSNITIEKATWVGVLSTVLRLDAIVVRIVIVYTSLVSHDRYRMLCQLAEDQNASQPNGGQPNGGQLNGGQPNGGQPNGGQLNGGQLNGGQLNGGQLNGGPLNGGQPNGGQLNGVPSNGGPLNGGQPNGGQLNGGQPNGGQPNGGQQKGECKYNMETKFNHPFLIFKSWFFWTWILYTMLTTSIIATIVRDLLVYGHNLHFSDTYTPEERCFLSLHACFSVLSYAIPYVLALKVNQWHDDAYKKLKGKIKKLRKNEGLDFVPHVCTIMLPLKQIHFFIPLFLPVISFIWGFAGHI